MSFKKKYVEFWTSIDTALGRFEGMVERWEVNRREAKAHPSRYLQWADRPYAFKKRPTGKPLASFFNALYENRIVRWINGV